MSLDLSAIREPLPLWANLCTQVSASSKTLSTPRCHPREGGDPTNGTASMNYYVYIVCSQKNGTLYIGVTNDITRRIYEHKNKMVSGFTEKYGIDKLVYMETYTDIKEAIQREKRLKKWNRAWKIRLIKETNPEWKDLSECFV